MADKRKPLDDCTCMGGLQIRNPLSVGHIDIVTMEEKEEEKMPTSAFRVRTLTKEEFKKEYPTEAKNAFKIPKKKPFIYRATVAISKFLLKLFPEDKLKDEHYKK